MIRLLVLGEVEMLLYRRLASRAWKKKIEGIMKKHKCRISKNIEVEIAQWMGNTLWFARGKVR